MAGHVPSDECDVVRLTFEEKDPSRKDDWHDLYVSRVNHLIDRIHSYRGEDRSYWLSLWSDHRTFGGVRVATLRFKPETALEEFPAGESGDESNDAITA